MNYMDICMFAISTWYHILCIFNTHRINFIYIYIHISTLVTIIVLHVCKSLLSLFVHAVCFSPMSDAERRVLW